MEVYDTFDSDNFNESTVNEVKNDPAGTDSTLKNELGLVMKGTIAVAVFETIERAINSDYLITLSEG